MTYLPKTGCQPGSELEHHSLCLFVHSGGSVFCAGQKKSTGTGERGLLANDRLPRGEAPFRGAFSHCIEQQAGEQADGIAGLRVKLTAEKLIDGLIHQLDHIRGKRIFQIFLSFQNVCRGTF